MDEPTPCPFRYIYKGRTFCAVAIRERRYTTTEVVPAACEDCPALQMLTRIGCAHINLGVEVDQYGGSHAVNIIYASCERRIERIYEYDSCGRDACPLWAPFDESGAEAMRKEALAAQRERESNFDA